MFDHEPGFPTGRHGSGRGLKIEEEEVRPEKKWMESEYSARLSRAQAVVLTKYTGLSSGVFTGLRRELEKIEVDYLVVKNRLFRRTLQESSFKPLAEQCREQTAVAMVVGEDLPAALKVFLAFAEKNGGPVVLAAMWGGNIFSGSGIKRLAGLPGRRELLAQLLRGVQSPLSGFVGTLNGLLTGLVVALKGITEKKSEAAG